MLEINKKTDRGELRIKMLSPKVIYCQHIGYMDKEMAEQHISVINGLVVGRTEMCMFCDVLLMTGLSPDFRKLLTPWHKQIRPQLPYQYALVVNKVVAMALSVTNMLTGSPVTVTGSRAKFDAYLRKHLEAEGEGARPSSP
jgi:hypothetical protein